MTGLVLDTSLVIHALTHARADQLLWRRLAPPRELHAPAILDFEVLHATRGLVLGGRLDAELAGAALEDFASLPIVRHPAAQLAQRIWDLRHNFGAYDASYVALAEMLGIPILTGDAKLVSEAHGAEVQVYPGVG